MGPARTTTPLSRLWHGYRTQDLVARSRWLFFVLSGVSLLLTVAGGLSDTTPAAAGLVLGSAAVFAGTLTYRYRAGRSPLVLDGADVLATFVLTLACPQPPMAFGITYAAIWFRAVFGRSWEVVGYAAGLAIAMATALPLWHLVPGHDGIMLPALVLGTLPSMLLNGVVARHLSVGLFARQRAQQRDASLMRLGTRLLGDPDPESIHRHAWEAAESICAATPGLRVIVGKRDGDALSRAGHTGDFVDLPERLPVDLVPDGVEQGSVRIDDPSALTGAAGFEGEWVCLALPEERQPAFMFVGAPGLLPEEGVVAIQSMVNQVALAMRNSEAHRDLEAQALSDALTGLANRAAFNAGLAEAVAAAQEDVWVLFVDLDDFKVVNDGLGHVAGDELLRIVARRLEKAVRDDDVCARLGGDEFGILLRGAAEETVHAVARRLVELSSAPLNLDGRLASVGASIGVAALRPGMSEVEVVQQADIAMYAAKAAGKNRVQSFHPGLLRLDAEADLELELRTAIEEGQFTVAYQPILSTADGRCAAVEALVRWDHPVRGLLTPIHFLDVAERTGLIVPMGEQVLRQACADAVSWQELGLPLSLHVNASPSQIGHPDFADLVQDCLDRYGLAAGRLVIEITETTALDSSLAQETLHALVALGVRLAVDDFGTGYAALTALRNLPIDIVKIDKSFVAGAATEVADQAVLQAVAEMAGRMGLHTVAEGVEDPAQHRFVLEAGITAVQGYLHLRPVPAAELAVWLRDPALRRSDASTSPVA